MSRSGKVLAMIVGVTGFVTSSAVGTEDARDQERVASVAYLVEMLASRNAAPPIKGDGEQEDREIHFPKEYDKALQVPVYLAMQQLLAEGEIALDALFAHAEDDRYSFSVNSYEDRNVSVSEGCRLIADRILFPFASELRVISRQQYGIYPKLQNDQTLAGWWKANKGRGLAAIQVEAIDATIRFLERADRTKVASVYGDAPPLPAKKFERDRQENLRILRRIRKQIKETKEPYVSRRLFDETEDIYGLPWARRKHNM